MRVIDEFMSTRNPAKTLIPIACFAAGMVLSSLLRPYPTKLNVTISSPFPDKLKAVQSGILKECQDHEFSSLSEPYAPDMVEVRKFINFQLCSPDEASIIMKNLDATELALFLGCLKDMSSGPIGKGK